jgi:hypothetical protein
VLVDIIVAKGTVDELVLEAVQGKENTARRLAGMLLRYKKQLLSDK